MNSYRKTITAFLLLLIILMHSASAKTDMQKPDLEREKRMAAEVEDSILDGDVVFLKTDENANENSDHEFMAIDTKPDGDEKLIKGAVVILHGRGFHPDWEDAIQPLRIQLAEHGWRTLSLQMPVLEKAAKYYDYVPLFPLAGPRIEAGIQYLNDQGTKNIILLAHSCGAHMAMDWISTKGDGMINAYIGVGMGATDYKQSMKQPFPLADMKVPVLDIYGADEYPAVIRMAPDRKTAMEKAGNKKSKQIIVPDANHYFTDKGNAIVSEVVKWLDTLK
ncbi:MAG: DUF3530 family protein [Thiotrichaceae bacterium]